MKALKLIAKDTPLAYEEVAMPIVDAHEVLVELRAAALNHRDVWIQKGLYAGIKYPTILGSDGAGVVDNQAIVINPSLDWGDNPRTQSKAYSILGLPTDGTFAQYVKVPKDNIAPMPSHLDFAQAAALPLAGLTAYRALFTKGQAIAGDKVLISGIGGGVALFALQFAVAKGCEVWVTSSSDDKITRAIAMGAKGGVNYREDAWCKALIAKSGGGFDVIIDSAVSDSFADMVNITAAPGARVVFYGATALGNIQNIKPAILFWKQISIHGTSMGNNEEFASMLQFVDNHEIVPIVDAIFALNEGNFAMQKMDEGKQFGKIVLSLI